MPDYSKETFKSQEYAYHIIAQHGLSYTYDPCFRRSIIDLRPRSCSSNTMGIPTPKTIRIELHNEELTET